MTKLIKRIRENKKGFTLVEILVVLVIIAILAAASIPSMIGFINQARGKAYIAQARTIYVASQAAVSEAVGIAGTDDSGTITVTGEAPTVTVGDKDFPNVDTAAMITNLQNMLDQSVDGITSAEVTVEDSIVTKVELKEGDYTVTIEDGATTVVKN